MTLWCPCPENCSFRRQNHTPKQILNMIAMLCRHRAQAFFSTAYAAARTVNPRYHPANDRFCAVFREIGEWPLVSMTDQDCTSEGPTALGLCRIAPDRHPGNMLKIS